MIFNSTKDLGHNFDFHTNTLWFHLDLDLEIHYIKKIFLVQKPAVPVFSTSTVLFTLSFSVSYDDSGEKVPSKKCVQSWIKKYSHYPA